MGQFLRVRGLEERCPLNHLCGGNAEGTGRLAAVPHLHPAEELVHGDIEEKQEHPRTSGFPCLTVLVAFLPGPETILQDDIRAQPQRFQPQEELFLFHHIAQAFAIRPVGRVGEQVDDPFIGTEAQRALAAGELPGQRGFPCAWQATDQKQIGQFLPLPPGGKIEALRLTCEPFQGIVMAETTPTSGGNMEARMAVTHAERIGELRSRCRVRKHQRWMNKTLIDAASFRASGDDLALPLRIAQRTHDRLAALEFAVDELELLVGRIVITEPDTESTDYREAQAYLATLPFASTPGQTGHCELERARLFELGLDALLEDLRDRAGNAADREQGETWQSFAIALAGLQVMIRHAEEECLAAVEGAEAGRAGELAEMAAVCRWVASQPPRSFREALQLSWFMDLAVSHADTAYLVSPGHLDRTLYPFLKRDLEQGEMDNDLALALVECFYILVNEYIPDGLAVAVMVGGVDENGKDLTNELSHLCLEALRRTHMVYPTVGICWTKETPSSLSDLAIDLIAQGYTTPAFFNDATIQAGLRQYGVPASESWNYINSTCVEITPVAGSNVWVASPYFSVCALLLEEIRESGEAGCPDFAAFLDRYMQRLGRAISQAVENENQARLRRDAWGGKPLQSVFTRDCIARGLDIDRGGARYNWVECSFVGLANLTDSLQVIKGEVFEQGRMDLRQLGEILAADFEGHELEKHRFQKAYPKYGHSQGEAEALLNRIILRIQAECKRHRVHPNGAHFVPGAFCWIMHEMLGKDCGATPDGRAAGTPFADGCGPAQGRETLGPTAAILSTTSWDASPLIGGAAYNMKFTRGLLSGPTGREGLKNLILTFLARGGFEVQINVVDSEAMRQARQFPEKYQDLVVRIGGYTDYFVRLSPRMQEELISRTEYSTF